MRPPAGFFRKSILDAPVYWSLTEISSQWAEKSLQEIPSFLSPPELQKLSGLLVPKRRNEWLHGRRAVKLLLFNCFPQLAGSDPTKVSVLNAPSGAPFFADENGKALPIALSLSHRAGWAACAITGQPDLSIGIDLECIEPRADSFVDTFFTEEEIAVARSLDGKQRDLWVTLVWSMKEAVLKALGQGLRLDTRSVRVQPPVSFAADEAVWHPVDVTCPQSAPSHWSAWFMRQDDLLLTLAIRKEGQKSDLSILQSIL
jgi:4'-phosphopantetheinyl transferase